MDLQILPAPIAYVRYLVDVEDDYRAKFDQVKGISSKHVASSGSDPGERLPTAW